MWSKFACDHAQKEYTLYMDQNYIKWHKSLSICIYLLNVRWLNKWILRHTNMCSTIELCGKSYRNCLNYGGIEILTGLKQSDRFIRKSSLFVCIRPFADEIIECVASLWIVAIIYPFYPLKLSSISICMAVCCSIDDSFFFFFISFYLCLENCLIQ